MAFVGGIPNPLLETPRTLSALPVISQTEYSIPITAGNGQPVVENYSTGQSVAFSAEAQYYSGQSYVVDDIVRYGSTDPTKQGFVFVYQCIQDTDGTNPPSGFATSNTYWEILPPAPLYVAVQANPAPAPSGAVLVYPDLPQTPLVYPEWVSTLEYYALTTVSITVTGTGAGVYRYVCVDGTPDAPNVNRVPSSATSGWAYMGVVYANTRAYSVGSIVQIVGSEILYTYRSLQTQVAGGGQVAPPADGSDNAYWKLLSTGGEQSSAWAVVNQGEPLWQNTITYYPGDVVSYCGDGVTFPLYMSLTQNLNVVPDESAVDWKPVTSPSTQAVVTSLKGSTGTGVVPLSGDLTLTAGVGITTSSVVGGTGVSIGTDITSANGSGIKLIQTEGSTNLGVALDLYTSPTSGVLLTPFAGTTQVDIRLQVRTLYAAKPWRSDTIFTAGDVTSAVDANGTIDGIYLWYWAGATGVTVAPKTSAGTNWLQVYYSAGPAECWTLSQDNLVGIGQSSSVLMTGLAGGPVLGIPAPYPAQGLNYNASPPSFVAINIPIQDPVVSVNVNTPGTGSVNYIPAPFYPYCPGNAVVLYSNGQPAKDNVSGFYPPVGKCWAYSLFIGSS